MHAHKYSDGNIYSNGKSHANQHGDTDQNINIYPDEHGNENHHLNTDRKSVVHSFGTYSRRRNGGRQSVAGVDGADIN